MSDLFTLAHAVAAIAGPSAYPSMGPLLQAAYLQRQEVYDPWQPGNRRQDWPKFMLRTGPRLTSSEKRHRNRELVPNIKVEVTREFACNQARNYYNLFAVTGITERCGRKEKNGVRGKWATTLYHQWCLVIQYGIGMVDGEVVALKSPTQETL